MTQPSNDSLEKLERNIDSRMHEHEFSDDRSILKHVDIPVEGSFGGDSIEDLVQRTREQKEHTQSKLFKRILFSSIAFFVLAVVVAVYIFFIGANTVSSSNINIVVSGPTSVAGGQELPLEVIIQNKNSAALEGVVLLLEYPDGSRVAGDVTTELIHQREPIGTVPARGEMRKTVKSVLFGEKESVKTIKISLEYRVQGSSATFSKEKNYDIGISSAPIIITSKYPSRIQANEPFSFTLDVTSNTPELLRDVLVDAEYPFGFTFTSSDPKPIGSNNVWRLGDLGSGDHRTIVIKGVLQGQNKDERTFRFSTGIAGEKSDTAIGAQLAILAETVTVQKPEVSLLINIAGENTDYTAAPGEKIPVIISWANNVSTRLINSQIKVTITGGSFDRNSVITKNGGFYRSSDNTIVWDKYTNPDFVQIVPGKKGTVGFTFSPAKSLSSTARNENIVISAFFDGNQLSADNIPIPVTTDVSQVVKIGSVLGFTNKAGRSVGPFENSGPIPPVAEQETTYTILWTLTNTLNDMSGVKVTTTLPPYIEWNNLTSPSGEKITYDSLDRSVTWDAGIVRGGTGFSTSPREAAFQVKLTPSLGQVNTTPYLINTTTVTGTDSFTKKLIQFERIELTTRTPNDPDYKQGDEVVVK